MSSAPTLKDLAGELGLSVSAVSQGLRNVGNISESTCRQIQEAAKRIGYRPNPIAAALSTGSRMKAPHFMPLAILCMRLNPGGEMMYPVPDFVTGITQRSVELGYRPEVIPLGSPADLPRQLKNLYNRGFQGIFIAPCGKDIMSLGCDWSPFSVVACGRYNQISPFHTVRQEIFESTRHLLNEVIHRGYRRICLALVKHDPPIVDDFARAAASHICRPPGGRKIQLFVDSPANKPADFARWLKKEKADAVVGFSVGHYYDITNARIKVPKDVGFAALHAEQGQRLGEISGLTTPHLHLGVVAANRMDTMIRHHERGIPNIAEQIALRSGWQEGSTLPFRKS
ncbi:MAG: LacI family DNA-binding transcriptional regulator [Verrucomicrobiota bacterium]